MACGPREQGLPMVYAHGSEVHGAEHVPIGSPREERQPMDRSHGIKVHGAHQVPAGSPHASCIGF